jgi:hypothetical protein
MMMVARYSNDYTSCFSVAIASGSQINDNSIRFQTTNENENKKGIHSRLSQ